MEKKASEKQKQAKAAEERASIDPGIAEAAYDNMSYLEMVRLKEQLREQQLNSEAEARVLKDFKHYVETKTSRKFKDPRKMIGQSVKSQIRLGDTIFNREFNTRQGYTKLLNKIQDSNFTLRQIKNGCSTLFDKDCMKINYTNPLLTQDEVKKSLGEYFEKTRPKRFVDDIESSTVYQS
jgi:hypothetical protein